MSLIFPTGFGQTQAASAYQASADGLHESKPSFGSYISNVMSEAISQGQSAEAAATGGLSGHGDLTQIVTSVAQAQLALQTTVAIRDRLIQAYQSVMSMPI